MDHCRVTNVIIANASKGFMNTSVFIGWLLIFEHNTPGCVERPIILVCDRYGRKYSMEIVAKYMYLNVILVILPVNATQKIHPLNISVFKPFTTFLKRRTEEHVVEFAVTDFSKSEDVVISSHEWG